MQTQLTDAEYKLILNNQELYFENCLQIRTKDKGLQPLRLNSSQKYAHEKIEKQLAETGRVRCLILKGRQQGISTYTNARYYYKTSTTHGVLAYIITHEDQATQNLFGMTKRYHDNNLEDFKPETGVANANELRFSRLDSGYKIATAGARTAGRSSTIQLAHLSEFDFWPDSSADDVFTGLMEAIPDADGTEVIIESTADKPGGRFHRAWKAAKSGESNFIAIFIPWFYHDEYTKPKPRGWIPPKAFEEYMYLHGITIEQLYWAWDKNRDMALTLGVTTDEFCTKFKREYPATDDEAFEEAGDELSRVFPTAWVKAAVARWHANKSNQYQPMTGMGVDVAQGGPDKTVLAPVHGVRFETPISIPGVETTNGPAVAGAVVGNVRDGAIIAVDLGGGWGGDTLTHLKDHLDLPAVGINPGAGAPGKSYDGGYEFLNMRAFLHWRLREALNPVTGDKIELPPKPELLEELSAVTFEITNRGVVIEKKENLKKVLNRSPDDLDAVLLGWHANARGTRALASAARLRRNRSAPVISRDYNSIVGRR